jgi:plastin-3
MDADASGFIEASELQDALDLCGIKLPGYEIRDIIKQNDTKIKDGKIDIDEFKTVSIFKYKYIQTCL